MQKHKSQYVNCVQALFKSNNGFNSERGEVIDYMGDEERIVQQGRAYNFNGTTDFVLAPHNASFNFGTTNFSIDLWFYATTFSLNGIFFRSLINKSPGTSTNGWDIFLRNTDSSVCFFTDSIILSSGTLSVNTWYRLTIVRNSNILRMYINNVEVAQVANTNDFTNMQPLRIGRNTNSTSFYQGFIHSIRFWNSVAIDPRPENEKLGINMTTFFRCDEGGGARAINTSLIAASADITSSNILSFHAKFIDGNGADWLNNESYLPHTRHNTETSGVRMINNSILNFGSLNWSIDFWTRTFTPTTTRQDFLAKRTNAAGARFLYGQFRDGSIRMLFTTSDDPSNFKIFSTPASSDTWYHIAYTRDGNFIRAFVNGTLIGEQNIGSASLLYDNADLMIGAGAFINPINSYNIQGIQEGFITMFRITRGISRFTTDFTPPSSYADYKPSFFDVYVMANPEHVLHNPFNLQLIESTNENRYIAVPSYPSPFYNGKVKYNAKLVESNCLTFDGINDFVQLQDSTDFDFGTDDFTIDFWINCSTFTKVSGNDRGIFDARSGLGNYEVYVNSAGSNVSFYSGFTQSQPNVQMVTNQWYHVAFVRTSGVIRTYYNFVLVNVVNDTNSINCNINPFLGSRDGSFCFQGSLANFRIIKGTESVLNLPNYTTLSPNTVLFMPLQEGAGNRVFSTLNGHIGVLNNFNLSTCWNTKQNNVHHNLFNGFDASTFFDGASSLQTPNSADLNFDTNDFTIDFWMRSVDSATNRQILEKRSSTNFFGYHFLLNHVADGRMTFYLQNDAGTTTNNNSTTNTLNNGAWHHIAVTRSGGTVRLFINGTEESSLINANSYDNTAPLIVGNSIPAAPSNFGGHLSNIRIFSGRALWTGTFDINTLTETHYQNETANRVLFLRGLEDKNTNPKAITNNGATLLVRKPITATNPQTQSNYSNTWHNQAETKYTNYLAPELIRYDDNTYFSAGTPQIIDFDVVESTTLKHSKQNERLANVRLYKQTGEK